MGFLIGLLTVVMVLDCVVLMFLVLIQLPKKEAGLGQAFGGATTEALFGAGSGNALTKMTKYSAGIFLALCVLLAWMNANLAKSRNSGVEQKIRTKVSAAAPAVIPPAATSAVAPLTVTPSAAPVATPPAATTPAPAKP